MSQDTNLGRELKRQDRLQLKNFLLCLLVWPIAFWFFWCLITWCAIQTLKFVGVY